MNLINACFFHNFAPINTSLVTCASCELELNEVLTAQEEKRYHLFKSEQAQKNFLFGRYCAKRAFLNCKDLKNALNAVEIKRGVFSQPILEDDVYDVSISHTKMFAAALCFNRAFPMGIDVEVLDITKVDILKTVVHKAEILQDNIIENVFAAWCMKEALSKTIKTGFTIPVSILEITNFQNIKNIFECEFLNFPQYKGVARILNNNSMLALAFPSMLTFKFDIMH